MEETLEELRADAQKPGSLEWTSSSSEKSYSDRKNEIALENEWEDLEGKKQDREQRKHFAESIFGAVMVYLFLTIVILFACGNGNLRLSDTVIVALLTTASANVIGILLVVVRYLFHHHK